MQSASEEGLREMILAFDIYIHRHTSPAMDAFSTQDIARAHLRRGVAHAKLNEWRSSLADLNRAIELTSSPGEVNTATLIRADVHFHLGQLIAALTDYSSVIAVVEQAPAEEALHVVEERCLAKLCRGKLYALDEQYVQAMEDFNDVLAHDSVCAEAYSSRGLARAHSGEVEQGLVDCNRALELEQAPYCYHRRGIVYALHWEFGAALADLEHANKLDPENADIQNTLAKTRSLARLGSVLGVLPHEGRT